MARLRSVFVSASAPQADGPTARAAAATLGRGGATQCGGHSHVRGNATVGRAGRTGTTGANAQSATAALRSGAQRLVRSPRSSSLELRRPLHPHQDGKRCSAHPSLRRLRQSRAARPRLARAPVCNARRSAALPSSGAIGAQDRTSASRPTAGVSSRPLNPSATAPRHCNSHSRRPAHCRSGRPAAARCADCLTAGMPRRCSTNRPQCWF